MSKYRNALPQLDGGIFLSDGGMETTFIFHDGLELPHFASFVLLDSEAGRRSLKGYYEKYLAIARDGGVGFVLDTATWRANADWGAKLGYDAKCSEGDQPCLGRAPGGAARRMGKCCVTLRDQRCDRTAWRRLQGWQHGCRGSGSLSRPADRGVCRHQCRHGVRIHAQQYQRGDRRRPRGEGAWHALRHLVHGRDRRQAGDGQDAAGSHRDRTTARLAVTRSTT